jgi:hypothetical protein
LKADCPTGNEDGHLSPIGLRLVLSLELATRVQAGDIFCRLTSTKCGKNPDTEIYTEVWRAQRYIKPLQVNKLGFHENDGA